MWKEYLAKARLYKKLADYYRYINAKRSCDYERICHEYMRKFAEAYERETGLDPNLYFNNFASHSTVFKSKSRLTAIRLLHASQGLEKTPVDVYVEGRFLVRVLPYGVVSKYFLLPAGEYRFDVFPTGKKRFKPLSSQPLSVEAGTNFLIGVADQEAGGGFGLISYREEPYQEKGRVRIRFIHLAKGVSALNIALPDGTVLAPGIGIKEATEYLSLSPMRSRFVFKQAKTEEVIFTTTEINLRAEKVYSMIILYPNRRVFPLVLRDLGRFSPS